jgi:hypothetical protein
LLGASNPTISKKWKNQVRKRKALLKDTEDSAAGPVVGVLLSLSGKRQRAAGDTSPSVFQEKKTLSLNQRADLLGTLPL